MNTFEIFIILTCFIPSDSAQGLQQIFPEVTVSERLESHSGQLSGGNIKWSTKGDRFTALKNSLSTVGQILMNCQLVPRYRPNKISRISPQFDYLRGVIVPPFRKKMHRTDVHKAHIASGFTPSIYPRRNTMERSYEQPRDRNLHVNDSKRKLSSRSSKRSSAITPPSRDWCRLIGYRVCPRAAGKL